MTARTHTHAHTHVRSGTRWVARLVGLLSAVVLLVVPMTAGLFAQPSLADEPKSTTTTVSPKDTTTTTVSPKDTTTTTVSPKDTTTTTVSPKDTTTTTVSPKDTTTTTVSPKDTTTTTVSPKDTTTTTVSDATTTTVAETTTTTVVETTTTTKATGPEQHPREIYEAESPIIGLIPPISMVRENVREASGPAQVTAGVAAPVVSVLGVQVERDQLPFTGPLGDSGDWAVLAFGLLVAGSAALAWVGRASSDRL